MRQQSKNTSKPHGDIEVTKSKKEILRAIAAQSHKVTENGQQRRISTLDLIVLSLRNKALQGNNMRATNEFHRLLNKYDLKFENEECGYLLVPADLTYEEFIAELEAQPDTPRPGTEAHDKYTAQRCAESKERAERRRARLLAVVDKYIPI
jgi:hypothetical protein